MKLSIGADLLTLFPDALVGVIELRGIDNGAGAPLTPPTPPNTGHLAITASLRQAEAAARQALGGVALTEEPRIACWRDAYRKFGANPKKNPSSIESLLRRVVVKGEVLRPINSLVDIYNAVSLERLLPIGGEDLDRVHGDILLCRAGDHEAPVLMLGESDARPPHPGEVIYRDGLSAICRRWNWKEAERTKLTAQTRHAMLVVEALPPSRRGDLEPALADLAGRVTRHCGGQARAKILDADDPRMEFGGSRWEEGLAMAPHVQAQSDQD